MGETASPVLLRFEGFELDLRTRELRRDGRLVKMQDLPIKLLALLASRPAELVNREEIEKALWGEDQFVDFEHGINTAMRKVREALGEDPEQPRFIETLPRKGYRFIAAVESVGADGVAEGRSDQRTVVASAPAGSHPDPASPTLRDLPGSKVQGNDAIPTTAPPDFLLPRSTARGLFLLAQAGYLAIYFATLYKIDSAEEVLLSVYGLGIQRIVVSIVILAMCGLAVRLYLLTTVGLNHPAAADKFQKLFPVLFLMDAIWALAPLLLVRKIGIGLALASVAAMAYLPFAQRTLMKSLGR
jgi:DNA-binding winged helix-turn-helix (wHTH) protein